MPGWIDWFSWQSDTTRTTVEAAMQAIEKAGCPPGVWKEALRDYQQVFVLPTEQWVAYAERSRSTADALIAVEEQYRDLNDFRGILRATYAFDKAPFDDPLPFLPPMEDLAAALNKGADICEKRAAQQQGQRSAGIYEARARCVREIKESIRGRVPVKAIATLLTAIGDADGRDVEVTTASLKMALHAEETQNVERR